MGSGKQSLHKLAVGLPVPACTVPDTRVPTQLPTYPRKKWALVPKGQEGTCQF